MSWTRVVGVIGFVVCSHAWASTPEDEDILLSIPSLIASSLNSAIETQFSINADVVKFGADDNELELMARGAASVKIGTQTIYIGTQQKTSINQDPILRSFDSENPARNWLSTSIEVTGADARGVSLFWSGGELYASFTVDGTQGQASQDFRRVSQAAQQSWLRSYGAGGGAKVSVVALIDVDTGALLKAVYLSAVLSSGRSNTLLVNGMRINSVGNLEVTADSFFAPRNIDGEALPRNNDGPSPFNYMLELATDLSRAIRANSSDY